MAIGETLNFVPRNTVGDEIATRAGRGPWLLRRPRRGGGEIPEGKSVPAVTRRDTIYRRLLAVADVTSAAVAGIVAIGIFGEDSALRPTALLALPIVALVSKTIGLYDRDEHLLRKTTLDEAPALFQVATLYALLAWLADSLFVTGAIDKYQVVGVWLIVFASMFAARLAARRLAQAVAAPERCLVIGDAASTRRLRGKLDHALSVNAIVVGRVPLLDEDEGEGEDPDVLGTLDLLGLTLVEHDIHRAVIAPEEAEADDVLDAIRMVKSLGVKVSVLPRLFEVVGSSVEFDDVDGVVLLGVRRFGLTRSSSLFKRATDLAIAGFALVLLAPLLAWIALAIRFTSPGPVLFRQKRIGRSGREFVMFKFRTMCDGAEAMKPQLLALNEADGLFKIADDPRITRVGRFLRQSSLDELPQLLNVIRGEMSLVGPRPLVPSEDRQVEGWHRRRLNVPPGMTGLWQIFGSSRIPMQEMVKIDYLYGTNWSPWLDIKILLRTVPYALGRRGL